MILLDTHAALWLLLASPRLGRRASSQIRAEARVCFSAVAQAEVTIKRTMGRLNAPREVHRLLVEQGLEELPLTAEHAAAMEEFPALVRHDPFDRLVLAQAHVERARFVTADRRLLRLGLDWVLDASA